MNKQKITGVIKNAGKYAGKYTLKGLGKGTELLGRTAVKTVGKLANNPEVQKIALLAASVAIPSVGVTLLGGAALKFGFDKMLGKDKNMMAEIGDMLQMGTSVTRGIMNVIGNPMLGAIDKGTRELGKNYQKGVDNLFR